MAHKRKGGPARTLSIEPPRTPAPGPHAPSWLVASGIQFQPRAQFFAALGIDPDAPPHPLLEERVQEILQERKLHDNRRAAESDMTDEENDKDAAELATLVLDVLTEAPVADHVPQPEAGSIAKEAP